MLRSVATLKPRHVGALPRVVETWEKRQRAAELDVLGRLVSRARVRMVRADFGARS